MDMTGVLIIVGIILLLIGWVFSDHAGCLSVTAYFVVVVIFASLALYVTREQNSLFYLIFP